MNIYEFKANLIYTASSKLHSYLVIPHLKKKSDTWYWRDGSAVKSTHYSYRGLEIDSQSDRSQLPVTPTSGDSSSGLCRYLH